MMTKTMLFPPTTSAPLRPARPEPGGARRATPDRRTGSRRLDPSLAHLAGAEAAWASSTAFDPEDLQDCLDPEFDDLGCDPATLLRVTVGAPSSARRRGDDGDPW